MRPKAETLGLVREKREYYLANPKIVDDILRKDAKKANEIASLKMNKIRGVVGV